MSTTGAARGLGLDFTRQFAAKGWKVLACARKPDGLKGLKGDIHQHTLEVTDYKAVKALAKKLNGEAIDVLICNAGVGGDRVNVTNIVPVGASPETFQPTPQDVATVAQAQLLVENGAGLDTWLGKLLSNASSPNSSAAPASVESTTTQPFSDSTGISLATRFMPSRMGFTSSTSPIR